VRGDRRQRAPVKFERQRGPQMNTLRSLISALRHGRAAPHNRPISQASLWARSRFRHSMLGESGIHEAVRLFGVGR
jgi:hypothetical protein